MPIESYYVNPKNTNQECTKAVSVISKFQMKLVDAANIISTQSCLPKDARVEVNVIHQNNIQNYQGTGFYREIGGANFLDKNAIGHNNVPVLVHDVMEHIKQHGKAPDWAELNVVCKDDRHGGIPVIGKIDRVNMDIFVFLDNNDTNNLRKRGDGPNELREDYKHHTIVLHSIREEDLVTIEINVEVHATQNPGLDRRQFHFATCKKVLASFPMWKKIENHFTRRVYYLGTPNILQLLTARDTNQYVQNNRNNQNNQGQPNYYGHVWDADINLDQVYINTFFNTGKLEMTPIYKMIHTEWIDGKFNIFFSKCPSTGTQNNNTDWCWMNYKITDSIAMCVSSLAFVNRHGIAPVKLKRDPPSHQGYINGIITNGCVIVSQSGHCYTAGGLHDNCHYRIVMGPNGYYIYPQFDSLDTEAQRRYDNFLELTQNIQLLGCEIISHGLEIPSEETVLEGIIDNFRSRLDNR